MNIENVVLVTGLISMLNFLLLNHFGLIVIDLRLCKTVFGLNSWFAGIVCFYSTRQVITTGNDSIFSIFFFRGF